MRTWVIYTALAATLACLGVAGFVVGYKAVTAADRMPKGPPPYAATDIEKALHAEHAEIGRHGRITRWGPSWEPTPEHLAFMKARNVSGLMGGWLSPGYPMPEGGRRPVIFIQEVTYRSWLPDYPSNYLDQRRLFLFDIEGHISCMIRMPAIDWREAIPAHPEATP